MNSGRSREDSHTCRQRKKVEKRNGYVEEKERELDEASEHAEPSRRREREKKEFNTKFSAKTI